MLRIKRFFPPKPNIETKNGEPMALRMDKGYMYEKVSEIFPSGSEPRIAPNVSSVKTFYLRNSN